LRLRQAETLRAQAAPHWHDSVESLPELPLFLVANEFFDALPIRQFQRSSAGWSETQVALADGGLVLARSTPAPAAALDAHLPDTQPGDIVEMCPALAPVATALAGRVARHGGAAIVIDYGGWHGRGDTFQAVARHRPVDPLAAPGEADLSAHVDFEALARAFAAAGAEVTPMVPQGRFLSRLGIDARAERLGAALTGDALDAHQAAHRRLTHPREMGESFKVIACHPRGAPPPPGLDTD